MKIVKRICLALFVLLLLGAGIGYLFPERRTLLLQIPLDDPKSIRACLTMIANGFRDSPAARSERFSGKVGAESTAFCRGGDVAVRHRGTPWVDWSNYYGAGDASSLASTGGEARLPGEDGHLGKNGRGVDGALMDLEYQRIELIKFNLFDNYTWRTYVEGRNGKAGPVLKTWDEMRLPPSHPAYADVGGAGDQLCTGELIRFRNLDGSCNDIFNPAMGSSGMEFARNVQFEATFPRSRSDSAQNRRNPDRGNDFRGGLLDPDPQLISRLLFSRARREADDCARREARDLPADAACDYARAPHLNLLAAFWIQFMTHDWFSHTDEGRNAGRLAATGCADQRARALGCRPRDRMEPSLYARQTPAETFEFSGDEYFARDTYLGRAPATTRNLVTAWWDASQIYGHDARSRRRVIRDPRDAAKLYLPDRHLPLLAACAGDADECGAAAWLEGQESVAFPHNWNIGLSFFHNLFAREHNAFVAAFRQRQARMPDADSGLRHPAAPERIVRYSDVGDDELFEVARLVVAAVIAKIHTIEWTTQLLYNEPLYRAMHANWSGLFDPADATVGEADGVLRRLVGRETSSLRRLAGALAHSAGQSEDRERHAVLYSVLASGAGIVGLGSRRMAGIPFFRSDRWSPANPADVNGGVNHFGSPFNFTEEFVSVYRLHPLLPDLLEFRRLGMPNRIEGKLALGRTLRDQAAKQMRAGGIDNWALSLGRQRMGALQLRNHPQLLQDLPVPEIGSPSGRIDVAALDIIRDRERGLPRYNEFRRQLGLRSLTGFDDFIDRRAGLPSRRQARQREIVAAIREVYGTHECDESIIISEIRQLDGEDSVTDCLGHADGAEVDNIENLDLLVGWLAESTRPHGFAISETQFYVFVINASRRLFSDRFLTSSFRPEFYTTLGYDWVGFNGPRGECPLDFEASDEACYEPLPANGHRQPVSPLKRVLLRNLPALAGELRPVVNAFDPWARDRGEYYSLQWKALEHATGDPAFAAEPRAR